MYRKLSTSLAILAATAGASAFAASAHAAVVNDSVIELTSDSEVQLYAGRVNWDFSGGTVAPRVTGTLKMHNERCFRVHLFSYDGDTLLHDKHGAKYCVKDDSQVREQPIDFSDVADARTDRAVVAVEEQNQGNDDWVIKEETGKHFYDAELAPWSDVVQILGDGIDLGGGTFDPATGNPTQHAPVSWSIDDGSATATVHSGLYLDDFAGMCGRVELRYRDEAGKLVDTVDGSDANCPADNGQHTYNETLAAAPSPQIFQVEVAMQSSPNVHKKVWTDVGTQTVSIAE